MTTSSKLSDMDLILWRNIYKTYTMFKKCEDKIFSKYGLTSEQYAVLVTTKFLDKPVRPIDIARWLERSPNSVSMLVDRMVKAGLVKTRRDAKDRREVHLTMTSKAEDAFKPATMAVSIFIEKILSPISHEDKLTLTSLLTTINHETLGWLSAGADVGDIDEKMKYDDKRHDKLIARLLGSSSTSSPEAKRQTGDKRKAK